MAQDLHRNLDPLRIANSPSTSHLSASTPRSHSRPQHASELKPSLMLDHDHLHLGVANKQQENMDEGKLPEVESIFLSSNSSEAQSMISPFLTEHIPQQYNPFGSGEQPPPSAPVGKPSTSYCYRHNPDSKCRRTANEPTMEELQSELGKLSQSDQQGISTVWSLFSAAPSKHRNLMLQGILAQCCFPQLSFISSSVRDLIKIDFMSALPVELGTKILCYLDTASLCRAAQVSQRWRILADDDRVWRKMCEQHIGCKCTRCGWGLPVLEQQRLRMEKRQMQMRANHRGINEWSPQITPLALPENTLITSPGATPTSLSIGEKRSSPHDSANEDDAKRICKTSIKADSQESVGYFDTRRKRPWKDVYKDRFKVGSNWKSGRCSLKFFRGHTNGIMCLQFDNNILATGSYDNTAKIWDIETGKELRTLSGHTAGIRCLQFDDSRLFTGSIDATLKVWNWRTGECVRTFRGHTRGIISLHFSDKILASGSMDNTIKIWNLADKQTFSLRGHTDWVNCVKIDSASRTLFSASDDCTVRLWDLETRTCIRIFRGHVGQVQQVLPLGPEFELDDDDDDDAARDDLPDLSDEAVKPNALPYFNYSRRPGDSEPESQPKARPPKYMLTGSLDSTIRLWHVPSGRCVRTFFGHLEGIWALAADSLRMVSGAEDRMVKIWDPRTGEHERTFTGHAGPVTCVGLSDDRLATGSEDCEVRLYSFEADHELQAGAEGEDEGRVACRGTPG